jgi:hypothetical protein
MMTFFFTVASEFRYTHREAIAMDDRQRRHEPYSNRCTANSATDALRFRWRLHGNGLPKKRLSFFSAGCIPVPFFRQQSNRVRNSQIFMVVFQN